MNQSRIHTNVMRRVHIIHALQPLITTTALSTLAFLFALWGIGKQVWVAQVVQNMPSLADSAAFARFMLAAFANTEFVVQALVVIALAAVLWMVADALRSLRQVVRFA